MRYCIIALSHLQRQPFNKVCNERKSALSRDKIAVIIPCYNEEENVIPLSEAIIGQTEKLSCGYDYELIFTAPPAAAERIFEAGLLSNTPVSRIGRILEREETAVVVRTADGLPVAVPSTGYDHFNAEDPE